MKTELKEILQATLKYLGNSIHESPWCAMTIKDLNTLIQNEIQNISLNQPVNEMALIMAFGPTGALQETAIENDWTDEYIKLSSQFDRVIDRINE